MRRRLVLAAVAAAAIPAAAAAFSAKQLVLQRSDMPAGAKRVAFGTSRGGIKIPRVVHGRSAYVGWRFTSGGASESVGAGAGVLASTKDAHDVLAYVKRIFRRKSGGAFKRAAVPRYGDEQFAIVASAGGLSSALVFVRSGTRLWEVVVFGYPKFAKARAIRELKKYAVKEKARAT